ncbi:MAG: hypothetical protein ACOH1Y_09210 [Propionicimonas sp.]
MLTSKEHPTLMDLTTATPAEIDTVLQAAANDAARATADHDRAVHTLNRIDNGPNKPWNSPTARAEAVKDLDLADHAYTQAAETMSPLNAEFSRRGGWTRYYLVLNTGGHVHASTRCDTCFPTTEYAWLTEQSGMTPQDLVDLAGESACTSCFKWAPVSVLHRPSVLEAPARKAARLQREADKQAKDAKAAAAAITSPEGNPVRDNDGRPFKTERAAEIEAVSNLANDHFYGYTHPTRGTWITVADRVIVALAHKHGATIEVERARITAKVDAKIKRDEREAVKHRY